MNVDELQSVQSRERQTDQLQQLRATFYEEAGQFIQQLREERDRAAERAEDPFDSPEVNRLTDDIKTAEQTVEAVYERRVGKIVKMASLAAADMPTEDDGLTQEERNLFETMVEAIESNRGHVLDVIAGEAPTGTVGDQPTTNKHRATPTEEPSPETDASAAGSSGVTEPTETGVDAADMMGGSGEQSSPSPAGEDTASMPDSSSDPSGDATSGGTPGAADRDDIPVPPDVMGPESEAAPTDGTEQSDVDRRTVRITDDVGEIFGVDQREYDLSTDDVVTLPADNADPLVEQGAAESLE